MSEVEYLEENILGRIWKSFGSLKVLQALECRVEYRSSCWQLHLVGVVVGTRRLGVWLICGTVVRVELALLLNHLLAQKSRVDRVLRRLVCHLRRPVTPSGCSSVLLGGGKALAQIIAVIGSRLRARHTRLHVVIEWGAWNAVFRYSNYKPARQFRINCAHSRYN